MGALLAPTHVVILLVFLIFTLTVLRWAVRDARSRGKSPLAVMLLVIAFFPLGLAIWLVFRPERLDIPKPRGFRLEDHQLQ